MPSFVRKFGPRDEVPDLRAAPDSHDVIHSVEALAQYVAPRRGKKSSGNVPTPGFRLGEYIRSLIEMRGLDRQFVTDYIEISRSSLDHIVAGYVRQPDIETVLRLARLLGVSQLDIFAHMDTITQDDIRSFMLGHVADEDLDQESAWSSLAASVAQLTPDNRRLALEYFVATLKTMQAYHRNAA